MIESKAVVVRVQGDYLWVDVEGGCANCDKSAGCGLGDGRGKALQRVRNTIGASVGDTLTLSVPEGTVLKAVLRTYLLPLLLSLVGAAAGTSFGGEFAAALGAVIGLAAGWISLRWKSGGADFDLRSQSRGEVIQVHKGMQS